MSSDKNTTRKRILEATWKLMEERHGRGVSMGDIAEAAGISRQAVYLHFGSRTDLMIATTQYVDEVNGLEDILKTLHDAANGIELLNISIDIWVNYIPKIFGMAKALLATRETDADAAAAWKDRMDVLYGICQKIIKTLDREGTLAPQWSQKEAADLLWTIVSVYNWEQLTNECGWTTSRVREKMKVLLHRAFVVPGAEKK